MINSRSEASESGSEFDAITPPAWLGAGAPDSDVVLSTRCRVLRNLRGHRFPHRADDDELLSIHDKIVGAAKSTLRPPTTSESEQEYLVGSRLVSHDFKLAQPGRTILVDESRSASLMVNEEDHIRLQGFAPGWNPVSSPELISRHLSNLSGKLEFAHSPRFGYLAASPFNCGQGRRLSAMFHLVALAHSKRLPTVLKALSARNLTARGLYGESSRAVGAFMQVSLTDGVVEDFVGACEYLIREERKARGQVSQSELEQRLNQSADFLKVRAIGLGDSLRVLSWARLAACAGIGPKPMTIRNVDILLTLIQLDDDERVAAERARMLRSCFGL